MTKQSRKRTAEQQLQFVRTYLRGLVDLSDVASGWHSVPEVKKALHRRPHRKPNFGWPFDNVNAIILKDR